MKLHVKRFDMRNIKSNCVILIIGSRGKGKTTLLEYMLYHLRNRFDVGCAMAETENASAMLRSHIPNALVYEDGLDMDILTKMQEIFKACADNKKNRRALVVFDDCMAAKKMKGETIRKFFMNGRHIDLTCILTLQFWD